MFSFHLDNKDNNSTIFSVLLFYFPCISRMALIRIANVIQIHIGFVWNCKHLNTFYLVKWFQSTTFWTTFWGRFSSLVIVHLSLKVLLMHLLEKKRKETCLSFAFNRKLVCHWILILLCENNSFNWSNECALLNFRTIESSQWWMMVAEQERDREYEFSRLRWS